MATPSVSRPAERSSNQPVRQELTGKKHSHKPEPSPATKSPTLPYDSEQFGIYQPLIGWRSQLQHERLSTAIAGRVLEASKLAGSLHLPTVRPPALTLRRAVDRTGSTIGKAIAAHVNGPDGVDPALFNQNKDSQFTKLAENVLVRKPAAGTKSTAPSAGVGNLLNSVTPLQPASGPVLADQPATIPGDTSQDPDHETAVAAVLQYLGNKQPNALKSLFRPVVAGVDRTIYGAGLLTHPSNSVFLSPIGILHLFREYFFEMGTFLGPPVGHVWVSPGGTLEVVESNTRRITSDLTTESTTTTTSKTENSTTDKDELSDAVKDENANNTKLGVTATAGGGIGVYHASATGSFNLDQSRKQAQETTHKTMREQSAKLSSEVQQNFKTTFRTVTETTDTSSRRYVLQNTTNKLVSYELSRKMRKVAVQVQDLGQRLCWQLYVDQPGDPLGVGEFVHAAADALDPNLKPPDTISYPPDQQTPFQSSIPFILSQGADSGATETYETSPNDKTKGIFDPVIGKTDIIDFQFIIKLPSAPTGFVLSQVATLDFHGAEVKWDPDLNLDTTNNQFTILLTHANFDGKPQLPFTANLVYTVAPDQKASIDTKNAANTAAYTDQLAAAKETQFYTTLRKRLALSSKVQSRPSDDLREEERTIIYRSLVSRIYGREDGWTPVDYHVSSELIRYFFDIDSMLYFVAPDWWRPRTQQLVPFIYKPVEPVSELQPTIMAQPAGPSISQQVMQAGRGITSYGNPGTRPYYAITEETAPAPQGASLGWQIQLDGDVHRNAFLNSPWVKAVVPINPGREREAIAYLQRPEVADTEGLSEPYPFDSTVDPPEYQGLTVEQVLLLVADKIKAEYDQSLKPVHIDPNDVNSKLALPTETVFEHGFDPLEGGLAFDRGAFKVFSEWTEILPTDQVVATEYSLKGL